MVRNAGRDFYLHELVELKSGLIVIPAFFFESNGCMYARCHTPEIETSFETGELIFMIPKDAPFDSPHLTSLRIDEFAIEYPAMTVANGGLMLDLCGNRLYGEAHFSNSHTLRLLQKY
jgi:hypothetical protein